MRAFFVAAMAAFAMLLAVQHVPAQSSITMQPGSDHLIEEYRAWIGRQDLFNSRGQRLTQPWQIIRQDRANYHRFGRADPGDEWDSFFASANNRERMERMLMQGQISPRAARAIVGGGVLINVQIFGRGSVGNSIRVTVLN